MPQEQFIVRSKQQSRGPIPDGSVGEYVKGIMDKMSPDKIVLIDATTDQKVTKEQLDQKIDEFASGLIELGVEPNDNAMFYADDSIEYFIANLSMIYLGLTTSPCKPANGLWETGQQLEIIEGKILLISCSKLAVIRQLMDDDQRFGPVIGALRFLIILDGENLSEAGRLELCKHRNAPKNVLTFQSFQRIGNTKQKLAQVPYFPIANPATDHLTIVFTSGTTGHPKGAIHSHRSMIAAVEFLKYSFVYPLCYGNCLGFVYPFGHVSGTFFMLIGLMAEMTIVMFSKYSDQLYLESIERYRINVVNMLNGFSLALNETDYTKLYDLSSMKLIMFGGSKFPKDLIENIGQRYRVPMSNMYGATEFLLGISNLREDYPYGSVGTPAPTIELKIVDLETGDSLPANREGEICLRGPNCFVGYLNNPKATRETIDSDGWYHSGDVGYYDQDDLLYITDRIKELVKYKHWSVPPAEIELFLQTHPAVLATCVVGVKHQTEGYHVRAYVQLREGHSATEQQLMDYVKANMGYHKRLNGGIRFIDSMPRSIIGKVDRNHFKNLVKDELLTKAAEPPQNE